MANGNLLEDLEKIVPFMLRAKNVEVGRDRLSQIRNRLAFLLVTEELSENSRDKILRTFPCPVYQALTMADIARLFGFQGTKVLGFRRSSLSSAAQRVFKGRMLPKPMPAPAGPGEPAPDKTSQKKTLRCRFS